MRRDAVLLFWWNIVAHICRNSVTFATEQSKLVIVPVASVTHTQLSKYKKLHSSQKFKLLTKVHRVSSHVDNRFILSMSLVTCKVRSLVYLRSRLSHYPHCVLLSSSSQLLHLDLHDNIIKLDNWTLLQWIICCNVRTLWKTERQTNILCSSVFLSFIIMWPTTCGHIMKRCGCLSVCPSVCLSVCLSRVISRKRSEIEP